MKSFLKLFLVLIFISPSSVLASKISVGTVVVDFNKDIKKNYVDVPIFNDSKDEKAYVQIKVYEILNPGTRDEKKVLVPKSDRTSIIVSPQRMIIEPSGKKNVRFIALNKDLKKDKVYRVNVAPIAGKFDVESGQYIKILIAYDVLTFIRPSDENAEFIAKRDGKKIIFESLGNTNVLLRKATQCPKGGKLKCKNIAGKRLYSGTKHVQELPFDNEVDYMYSIGGKIHKKTYE